MRGSRLRPGLLFGLLLAATVATAPPARGIEFPLTKTPPNVNGSIDTAAEWPSAGLGVRVSPNGVDNLADRGAKGADGIYALAKATDPGQQNTVTVRTLRDGDFVYFGLSVRDRTPPQQRKTDPERVLIAVATRAKLGDPVTKATAISLDTTRGLVDGAPDKVLLYAPTGPLAAGKIPAWGAGTAPNAADFDMKRTEVPDGYEVEAKLRLSALGYPAGPAQPDVQVLVVVFNSLDASVAEMGGVQPADAFTPAYFHAQLPPSTLLPYDDGIQSVQDYLNQTAHLTPANWAVGRMSALGDEVYLDRNPVWWAAYNSIRVGYCDSTGFGDPDMSAPGKLKWYQYFPPAPCGLKVWVRAYHRGVTDPGTPLRVRALALWGAHGAGNVKWTAVGLTEAMDVPVGPTFDFPAIVFPAAKLPVNLPNGQHPCIAVFLLPAQDRADLTGAQMLGINPATPFEPFQKLKDVYNITDDDIAQFNINALLPTQQNPRNPCPDCAGRGIGAVPAPVLPDRMPGALRLIGRGEPAVDAFAVALQEPKNPKDVEDGKGRRRVVVPPPPAVPTGPLAKNAVTIDIRALGFPVSTRDGTAAGRMGLIRELGGVMEVVDRDTAKAGRDVPFRFDVGNPDKVPRAIRLDAAVQAPGDLGNLRVEFKQPVGTFKPGETRTIEAVLTARPAPAPVPPVVLPCCPGAYPQVGPVYQQPRFGLRRWR